MKSKKTKNLMAKTVALAAIIMCLLAVFFRIQIKNYEKGILEIYSEQQDAYVQLVLDQINLKSNRDDQEIINEILTSLDASTNKYWTFADSSSMLFIKDVLETNKYKGLTAESYFKSPSAKNFIEGLKLNRVMHSDVEVSDKAYIASGVVFEYNGTEYSLVLLTNKAILLDNNVFLGAKVMLCTVIGIILVVSFLYITMSTRRYQKTLVEISRARADAEKMSAGIMELNEALRAKQARDTKQKLWTGDLFEVFIERLKRREVIPISVCLIKCDSVEKRRELLMGAGITLDESVMRFAYKDTDLLLLGTGFGKAVLKTNVKPLLVKGTKLTGLVEIDNIEKLDAAYILKALD